MTRTMPIVIAGGMDLPDLQAERMRLEALKAEFRRSPGIAEVARFPWVADEHVTGFTTDIADLRSAAERPDGNRRAAPTYTVGSRGIPGISPRFFKERLAPDDPNVVPPGDVDAAIAQCDRIGRLLESAIPDERGDGENLQIENEIAAVGSDFLVVANEMLSQGDRRGSSERWLQGQECWIETGSPYGLPRLYRMDGDGGPIDLLTEAAAALMQTRIPSIVCISRKDTCLWFGPMRVKLAPFTDPGPVETLRIMSALGVRDAEEDEI